MKLSEALYERKKTESRILRLMEYRKSIFNKSFPEIKDERLEGREKRYSEFLRQNRKEIEEINIEIDSLKTKYIELAHKITEKNFELDIDKKLMNMKFVRLELASLNRLREDRYSGVDFDKLKKIGIEDRLEDVEEEKRKLDNQIQQLNYSNDITL